MSKRPKMARSVTSRLRRPMGWLRDLPIWSKLGLIMIVPTVATIVVGTSGVIDHAETAGNADRARALARVVEASGQLVHGLQNERSAAVLLLGHASGSAEQRYRDAYAEVSPLTDEYVEPYARRRAELRDLPANVAELLDQIDEKLANLPANRSQINNATQLRLSDAVRSYDALINDLLDMRDSAMQLANDFGLSQRMRAAAATARAKEYLSQKRVVVHRAMIEKELTPALRNDFIAAEQGEAQALQSFNAVATTAEAELHSQAVAGPDLRAAGKYSDWVRTQAVSMKDAEFSVDEWDAALVSNARLVRNVESELDAFVVEQATAMRDTVRRQLFIETGLLLVMLLLAILFAWLVARSMARSLRELRVGALAVAEFGLPQAVARLRDPQVSAQLSPAQVADQLAEPLPVRSKDELGQVVEAFNKVHLEAVRTAAEQAALRASVNTMFVNLARRSQILVDRLITNLDRIEQAEEDPDRLAELFQLDHLVTRMRRNDENLLVLAGADSTRVQRRPAPLLDVLRAAQSEVEHYTRIEFGVVDQDLDIEAHAVNDLVHLIAELLDNATTFSPPDSQVMVEARRFGDRVMLYIEDHGIGLSAEQLAELNERLATPPAVDVAVSRMMGLVVVARLAARHGVKVELRSASSRGVIAEVMIPVSVLVSSERGQQSGEHAGGFPQQPAVPTQRRQFGAMLALEGGPSKLPPAAPERVPSGGAGGSLDAGSVNRGQPQQPVPSTGAMPAWSDLTGATTIGSPQFAPQPPTGRVADPLPQRRPDHESDRGPATIGGPVPSVPRQVPSSFEARPSGVERHVAAPPPVVSAPPSSGPPQPMGAAPAVPRPISAPPAWPPVVEGGGTSVPAKPEMPAPPVQADATAASVSQLTVSMPSIQEPESRPPFADATMELPIFRELESAWFRTQRSVPDEVATANAEAATVGESSGPGPSGTANENRGMSAPTQSDMSRPMPGEGATSAGTAGGTAMMNTPTAGGSHGASPGRTEGGPISIGGGAVGSWGDGPVGGWQTAADDGWRAASAAAEVPVSETTRTGLPKRVPMAQLVPGGVEKPTATSQRRTPEAVRGLLSAYHRGVQRGRSNSKDENPGATPAGQQFPQSGFGPVAGGGQKEHQG